MTTPAPRTSTAAADTRIRAGHPFVDHLRRSADTERAGAHRAWTPADGPLPSLYISHGAPVLFEMTDWMIQLHDWARSLPRPKSILIVSAHWESAPLCLSSTRPRGLVYDFGGFDPMYYQMRYDTPDAGELAALVTATVPDAETLCEHPDRGLDHGAWVPLKIMYPNADIPVLQLSMPTLDPERLLHIGRRLRSLRESGVLVIGSGYLTHGLRYLDWSNLNNVPAWSVEFDLWAQDALARCDIDELAAFRTAAPGMPYAHPTAEHYAPLFVTLGAATDLASPAQTVIDGYALGLAKRSLQVA